MNHIITITLFAALIMSTAELSAKDPVKGDQRCFANEKEYLNIDPTQPEWVEEVPESKDYTYVVGLSRKWAARADAKSDALNQGLVEFSKLLKAYVATKLKEVQHSAGIDVLQKKVESLAVKEIESVFVITGAKAEKHYKMRCQKFDGNGWGKSWWEYWSLVRMPKPNFLKGVLPVLSLVKKKIKEDFKQKKISKTLLEEAEEELAKLKSMGF